MSGNGLFFLLEKSGLFLLLLFNSEHPFLAVTVLELSLMNDKCVCVCVNDHGGTNLQPPPPPRAFQDART